MKGGERLQSQNTVEYAGAALGSKQTLGPNIGRMRSNAGDTMRICVETPRICQAPRFDLCAATNVALPTMMRGSNKWAQDP